MTPSVSGRLSLFLVSSSVASLAALHALCFLLSSSDVPTRKRRNPLHLQGFFLASEVSVICYSWQSSFSCVCLFCWWDQTNPPGDPPEPGLPVASGSSSVFLLLFVIDPMWEILLKRLIQVGL